MKNLILVSDLHLGDERFKENLFLDFLNGYVAQKAAHLVIAGDLFELIQQNIDTVLARSRKTIFRLWQLAEKIRITYIPGNHDLYLANFLFKWHKIELAYPSLVIKKGPYQIHVEHGHLLQEEYKLCPALYNDLARLGGFLNLFDPNLQNTLSTGMNALEKLKHNFSVAGKDKKNKKLDDYQQAALALTKKGADFVVFGHTHEPQSIALGGKKKYINLGDWVLHSTYGEFNSDTGDLSVKEWNK